MQSLHWGKIHSFPFKSRRKEMRFLPGEKTHYDLAGPFLRTLKGENYRVVFIDHKTGLFTPFFLKKKSKLNDKLKDYRKWVKTQTGRNVKEEQ